MGNLVSRALTLCSKHNEAKIPDFHSYTLFDVDELNRLYQEDLKSFRVHEAIEKVHARLIEVNKWLTEKAPWHMKDDQHDEKLSTANPSRIVLTLVLGVVRSTLEAVWLIGHFLNPIVPTAMEKVFVYLNTPAKTLRQLDNAWNNLIPGVQSLFSPNNQT